MWHTHRFQQQDPKNHRANESASFPEPLVGPSSRTDFKTVHRYIAADSFRLISARRMRENFWTFEPTHKIALATNHKPQVRGQDYAIWRRLRLIPFTVCFLEDKQDKTLGEKLRAEAPGILTWLVEGCKLWQQHGLQDPPEVLEATGQYRSEQDTLGAFLLDRCLQGPTYQAKASVLYAAYKDWCEQSGERSVSNRKFCAALREKGFEQYKNDAQWFRGVAVA